MQSVFIFHICVNVVSALKGQAVKSRATEASCKCRRHSQMQNCLAFYFILCCSNIFLTKLNFPTLFYYSIPLHTVILLF